MSAVMIEMNRAAATGLAALLNTLWYAGAVVGLTWLGLRCLPRVNAATRYWIWTAALASLLLLPFLPGLMKDARSALEARLQTTTVVAPLASVPTPPGSIPQLAPVTLNLNTAPGSKSWPLWLLAAWIVAAGWQLERLARGLASARRLKACAEGSSHDTFLVSWACAVDAGKPTAQKRGSAEFRFPETLRPFRWKEKSRGVKEQLRATSLMSWACTGDMGKPTAQKPCRGYQLPVNIRRQVRLMTSAEIASPVAVGYRHPVVIVPPGLLERLEDGERQNVLLHELAHLARYDDWMALLTHILGAVLIFHPLSAIVLKQIEREREMACDDFVVARTGSARSYARSLARLHDLRWDTGARLLAAGLLGRNSSLGDRIESLLRRGREFSARPSLTSLGVSALLLAVLLGAGGLMPGWIAIAQTTLPKSFYGDLPKVFEVASIRPGDPSIRGGHYNFTYGDRLSATNIPLEQLILYAYHIRPEQLEGLPPWAKSRKYTIQAVDPPGTLARLREIAKTLTPDERKQAQIVLMQNQLQMVQSLLADRFVLRVHRTTKPLPIYELVVPKGGPKLKYSESKGSHRFSASDGSVHAKGMSIEQLAEILSRSLERTVIDKTGLTGRYDIDLTWTPWRSEPGIAASDQAAEAGAQANSEASGPSIFTAVQQQLGLKLKPAKGPVEVLVIDHIEPPTPN